MTTVPGMRRHRIRGVCLLLQLQPSPTARLPATPISLTTDAVATRRRRYWMIAPWPSFPHRRRPSSRSCSSRSAPWRWRSDRRHRRRLTERPRGGSSFGGGAGNRARQTLMDALAGPLLASAARRGPRPAVGRNPALRKLSRRRSTSRPPWSSSWPSSSSSASAGGRSTIHSSRACRCDAGSAVIVDRSTTSTAQIIALDEPATLALHNLKRAQPAHRRGPGRRPGQHAAPAPAGRPADHHTRRGACRGHARLAQAAPPRHPDVAGAQR